MQTFWQDLRYGTRMLAKSPGTTIVAVLALALGIGANTAIFSGVSAFLLRALPVPEPDQLVRPFETAANSDNSDSFSYPDYVDYHYQNTLFQGLIEEDMAQAAISTQNQNDVIWGQVVSANFFDVLQVRPIMGRGFLPEEDKTPGSHPVVVVSHGLWQRRLGADPNIVGKTIDLNGRPYNVIGVAPDYFKATKFGLSLEFWAPMMMAEELWRSPGMLSERDSHWMNVLGRLKPGVTRAR